MTIKLDNEGYVIGYDPYFESHQLLNFFQVFGFVVVKDVLTQFDLRAVQDRVNYLIDNYSNLVDNFGASLISRGFMEIYHDTSLIRVRESSRFYEAHKIIWGTHKLWVTYDRFVVKQPKSEGLPLHLDQNPNLQSGFDCTQGLVGICNNCPESGSTILVPKSHLIFDQFRSVFDSTNNYNPIPFDWKEYNSIAGSQYNLKLKDGDGLIWDSRLIHANSDNVSDKTRIAALASYQPITNNQARLQRITAFLNYEAYNDRNARMHASIRPRFNDARFMQEIQVSSFSMSHLGKLVYGVLEYDQ
jgi:ectoine hydroxylase-related dioxygenase (phytanoyl-CoA dioxygenase family)